MVEVFKSPDEIAERAAALFTQHAQKAIAERGRFVVSLTGGSSPEHLYQLLAAEPYYSAIDWTKAYIFWGDERWVPLTDEKSNARMTSLALLDKVPVPSAHIYYMYAEGQRPEQFAATYESAIRAVLGDDLAFDLILLGMGPDGHTASLFPHEAVLNEQEKLVAGYYLQSQQMYRVTLTAPLINKAKEIIFMLFGGAKASALHEVLEGERNPQLYPAQLIKPDSGNVVWLTNTDAAAQLTSIKKSI